MKGFTLVETMVAITVVLIAMTGPFQVVQQALLASYAARDQLIASGLAEEGAEYIRAIRDGNYLYNIDNPATPVSWLNGVNGTGGPNCFAVGGCMVDPLNGTVSTFATSTALLKLDTNSVYRLTTGTNTRFTRKVEMFTVSATEVRVRVTVFWTTNRIPFSIQVTDTLHDWL